MQCRNSKLKCDRAKPRCKKCQTNHRVCTYDTSKPQTSAITDQKAYLSQSSRDPQSDEVIWPDQVGRLTADEDAQLRYYSGSSWTSALGDLETSQTKDFEPSQKPILLSTGNDQSGETPTEQLYTFVRPSEVRRLVFFFAGHCQFLYPVADIPEIMASLHCLGATNRCPKGSSALLAAMCYDASSSLSLCDEGDFSATDVIAWKTMALNLLFESGYPLRPTMNNLRAATLLAASSMAESAIYPDSTPICVLVRAAQSFGLHRDPDFFQFSTREGNCRRILWWSIRALDVSYAVAHALPPLIRFTDSDVKMSLEGDIVEVEFLRTMIGLNLLGSQILDGIYGTRKPNKETLQTLDSRLASFSADMVEQTRQPSGSIPLDFSKASERMSCYKLIFILHQPYLRSPIWPRESRHKALDACKAYIEEFVDTLVDPRFAPFRWFLNHWNIFHACAIILQDLTQNACRAESTPWLEFMESIFSRFYDASDRNWQRLQLLRSKALKANSLSEVDATLSDSPDMDCFSLSAWDPLFSSFVWDEP